MDFKQIEITREMTEIEQLHTKLSNWIVRDEINEYYKEDLEEYHEYVEEFKAPFESFTSIEQVKGIFYEVSTDAGKMYFVASPSFYEGKWEFEEVEKDMVDNIN